MASETVPNYAANRAWSTTDAMTRSMLAYLKDPADSQDRGGDFSSVINELDALRKDLIEVRPFLSSVERGTPDPRVLDVLERAIDLQVVVVTTTEIKRYRDVEAQKMNVSALLRVARQN